jgi:hypothetical protein
MKHKDDDRVFDEAFEKKMNAVGVILTELIREVLREKNRNKALALIYAFAGDLRTLGEMLLSFEDIMMTISPNSPLYDELQDEHGQDD